MSGKKFAILIGALLLNLIVLAALALAIVMKLQRTPAPSIPQEISIQLGTANSENGIRLNEAPKDASAEVANIGGVDCRVVRRTKPSPAYMYFSIDPSFKKPALVDALVTVEYFDQVRGEFRLNYDALDIPSDKPSPYKSAEDKVLCLGSQQWKKAHFLAVNARFQGSQHDGSDFRIDLYRMPELYVRRVTIQHLGEQ
jgi:hypothetical protein